MAARHPSPDLPPASGDHRGGLRLLEHLVEEDTLEADEGDPDERRRRREGHGAGSSSPGRPGRQADLRDRRVVVLALSDEGRRIIGRIERQRREMAESILGALSDAQLGELLRLIEVMVAGPSPADVVDGSPLRNPGPQCTEHVVPEVRQEPGREPISR